VTTVATFDIQFSQYIDPTGTPTGKTLPEWAQNADTLRELYRKMVRIRQLDAKAYALQRTGKMGTYPAALGQEAIGVGYGSALTESDVLCPYYRGQAAMIEHGVTMEEILLYWGGDERGSDFKNAREDFPIAVPIATQMLHATGVAKAFQLRNQQRCAVTEIGEGGTSEGDFYEALNVAGIWNLGVVFIINNNQWAISVPSEIQTACETYAQKAIAAGIKTLQVDGNDIIAVKEAAEQACKDAREGKGATLIECISLRLCDHTTADDASRYRPDGELEEGWKSEPIARLKNYLTSIGEWDDEREDALQKDVAAEVQAAVDNYLNTAPDSTESMFDYLYEELPARTLEQREYAINRAKGAQ
jgi:pyruvate dehydrogenase E1 component alpha subunit